MKLLESALPNALSLLTHLARSVSKFALKKFLKGFALTNALMATLMTAAFNVGLSARRVHPIWTVHLAIVASS